MAAKLDSLERFSHHGVVGSSESSSNSDADKGFIEDVDATLESGESGLRAAKNSESLSEVLGLHAGDEVGRYLLLSTLGSGAMGVVFSAYDPDLDRKIALKFIQPDPSEFASVTHATMTAQSRLLQEAQAMARVGHPNVVAVYDVGTVGPHVYLAMELIEGQTMKGWIREGGYSREQMVRVLSLAGRGLASAHDAGLVHRDFKPDNVLLGSNGRVCVADFGLVRQVQGGVANAPRAVDVDATINETIPAAVVAGTPSYMSPEQHRGEIATALSDQFSFCVSLFEAAYGVRPFLGRNLKELSEAIEGGEMTVPVDRHRVPRWLHRIILRGLSLDPQDRYPTMQDLLAELTLDRKALLRKWVGGGLAAASLAVGIGYHELSVASKIQPCPLDESGVEELWSSSIRSEVQQNFLSSGLGYAERVWSTVNESMQRQVIDWSEVTRAVCREHSQEAHVSKDIKLQIACLNRQIDQIHTFVDLLQNADVPTINKSADVARALPSSMDCRDIDQLGSAPLMPDNPKDRVAVQSIRQDLARSVMLQEMGKYPASCELGKSMLKRSKSIAYIPLLAEVYDQLAMQHCVEDSHRKRSVYNLKALKYAEASHDDRLTTQILSNGVFIRGCFLRERSSLETWIPHARAHLKRAGNPPLLRIRFLSDTGAAYGTHGRFEESEAAFREAVELLEQEFGNNHPDTLRVRSNLAVTLHRMFKVKEAIFHYRKAITHAVANQGPDHPMLALVLRNLGSALMDLGRFREGLTYMDRSVKVAELASGEDAPQSLQEYQWRGDMLERAGKYQRSLEDRRRVVRLVENNRGSSYIRDSAYHQLARTLAHLGRWEEAKDALREVNLERQSLGNDWYWQFPYTTAMEIALGTKDIVQAENIYRKILDLDVGISDFFSRSGSDPGQGRYCKLALVGGNLQQELGQAQKAMQHHEIAYSCAQVRYPGKDNVNLVSYERALARSSAALGHWGEAFTWMDKAIEKLKASLSDSPHVLAGAYLQLAKMYDQTKQREKARIVIHRAAEYRVPEEMNPEELAEIADLRDELEESLLNR